MAPKSAQKIHSFEAARQGQKLDRSVTKPLMEKRRRERINKSLTELKNILLEALKRDQSSCSKLEKADILEMTVKYLNQTKMMTGSYPSPYGQQTGNPTGSQTGFNSGYNRAQEECIKMIRENPALTEEQKIQMINQMTQKMPTQKVPAPARAPFMPNQAVNHLPPTVVNHPMMSSYFLQQQQYLLSLQHAQESANQKTPLAQQPMTAHPDSRSIGSNSNSDSESDTGSNTSSDQIFRPW